VATARAQLAAALDKVEILTRTAEAAVQQAQAGAAEARQALTAAAEERRRLRQRAEAAEALLIERDERVEGSRWDTGDGERIKDLDRAEAIAHAAGDGLMTATRLSQAKPALVCRATLSLIVSTVPR
jgi:hypothetical protein